MRAYVECGPNEGWRKAVLASALGTALALSLSPWLEAVLAPASALFAASFQALACNKRVEVEVTREVIVKADKAVVTLRTSKGKVKDFPSAPPVSGEPAGEGEVTYVVDLEESPFVFWPGALVELDDGACSCKGFVELRSFASMWRLEALGLGEPVEVEGGFMAVPEVEGAREYRPGDEPRLIIWKTLYKPGGPKVKELKRVTEVIGLRKGIRTFSVDLGPWGENPCFAELGKSLVEYLRSLGLKEVKGKASVAVLGPGGRAEGDLYLLLNPVACIPSVEGLEALELVRERVLTEFLEAEKRLRGMGEVRAVPWSVPPRHTL
ncbi:MAG: DUF58 domain-containing protein [Crenarchaeota archaeon]|nr:DUF58 domain-containing protein [Thermoproteota archaeon]